MTFAQDLIKEFKKEAENGKLKKRTKRWWSALYYFSQGAHFGLNKGSEYFEELVRDKPELFKATKKQTKK